MVNRERVRLLVDALRSGDWQQTRNLLCFVDSEGGKRFCCLGVAMELAIANGLDTTFEDDDGGTRHYLDREGNNPESNVLTPAAVAWYGFASANPDLKIDGLHDYSGPDDTASELNDSNRWDFNMIADAFENTYLVDVDAAH